MYLFLLIALMFICGMLAFLWPLTGLIAGLTLSIVLIYVGVVFEQEEPAVGGIVVLIITLLSIVFKKWGTWARQILIIGGLGLFAIASFFFFGIWGFFGLAFYLISVEAIIAVAVMSRLITTAYVISTISSSVRQNLPLPMAMEMAAAGQNNRTARVLQNMKKWLVEGYPLSESIKRGYPRFPGYATALIAVGERIGQVPQALAALEQDLAAKVTLSKKVRHIPSLYPPILLLVMFIIVLFMKFS